MDYENIYRYGFPHRRRTYFDCFEDAFAHTTIRQKLLDIGYLLTKGYDVRSEIHSTYQEHITVKEDDVRYTLNILLAELLNEDVFAVQLSHDDWTTDQIIDELFSQLLRYYNFPLKWSLFDNDHYLKNPMDITALDLQETNGWEIVVAQFNGNTGLYDVSGKEYIYPGDESFVHDFNDKHKESEKFVLNTIPYPWLGNPIKAKVVILSQNPGWVENSGKIIPMMLQRIPQIAEEIMEFFRKTYRLDSKCFMPEDWNKSLGFSARDAYNAMGDWYWKKRFHFLTDEGVNEETIYNNIAVVQYIPYSSVKYAPLPQNVILPSQIYTRRLIDYIRLNNKSTIFIVPRAVKLWEKFLGQIWADLEEQGRIIKHLPKTYRTQYISSSCLGADNFEHIVKIFKDLM